MVWQCENTVTSKRAPEAVWDRMTDDGPNDHDSPAFRAENKGKPWVRVVGSMAGSKVHLKDTAPRFWSDIVIDLSDRPNKIPTEGKASMGPWKGLTTLTRTPEGGTSWHSKIDITPERFGARVSFAISGGTICKSFIKHENGQFEDFEAAAAAK